MLFQLLHLNLCLFQANQFGILSILSPLQPRTLLAFNQLCLLLRRKLLFLLHQEFLDLLLYLPIKSHLPKILNSYFWYFPQLFSQLLIDPKLPSSCFLHLDQVGDQYYQHSQMVTGQGSINLVISYLCSTLIPQQERLRKLSIPLFLQLVRSFHTKSLVPSLIIFC